MNQNNCLGPASNPTSTIKQGYKNTYIFKILYFCTFSKTKLALKRFFFFLIHLGFFWLKYFFKCILTSIHTFTACLCILHRSWCFTLIPRNNTHMKLLKFIWGWHQHRRFNIHMQFSKNLILPPSLIKSDGNNPFYLRLLSMKKRLTSQAPKENIYIQSLKRCQHLHVFLKSSVEGEWYSN